MAKKSQQKEDIPYMQQVHSSDDGEIVIVANKDRWALACKRCKCLFFIESSIPLNFKTSLDKEFKNFK